MIAVLDGTGVAVTLPESGEEEINPVGVGVSSGAIAGFLSSKKALTATIRAIAMLKTSGLFMGSAWLNSYFLLPYHTLFSKNFQAPTLRSGLTKMKKNLFV